MAERRSQAAKRLEQLRDEIRKHDRLYYDEAAPIISDREYDRLYKELVALETQFPDLVTLDSPLSVWAESRLRLSSRSRISSRCSASITLTRKTN